MLHHPSALYECRDIIPSVPFLAYVYQTIIENIPQSIPYWCHLLRDLEN